MITVKDHDALDRLMQKCQDTMTQLEIALEDGNWQKGKDYLSLAEILRDALESPATPDTLEQGADLLQTKGDLDDAIVQGSFKLDNFFAHPYNGSDSYNKTIHSDDCDIDVKGTAKNPNFGDLL